MSSFSPNFSKYDVLSVYVEIAKRDTSEEIQNLAIDYMGQCSRNKNKSLDEWTPHVNIKTLKARGLSGEQISRAGNDYGVDIGLLIADGAMAVTGGRNIANEYFGASATIGFADLGVLMIGPVVQ